MENLFIDFDGTIANSVKKICDLYNEDYRYYDYFTEAKWWLVDKWDLSDQCDLATHDVIENYFCQPRFFDNLEFMENAKEVIKELSNRYKIHIVTLGETSNLKLKQLWLVSNFYDIDYNYIPLNSDTHKDKSKVDMSKGILIDDNAEYLLSGNADFKICYGDIFDWNDNWKGKRCFNWYDVKEYLMN